jgi:hypothetical protein
MEKEFIRYDCNFNKVFIVIEKSKYNNELINCYAYREINKYIFFTIKEYIKNNNSDLFDKRCNSFILVSEITENNYQQKINYLIDSVMKQVNEVLLYEKNIKKSYKLFFKC